MEWAREVSAGLALLTAAANLGYYFGSRRRVETQMIEMKTSFNTRVDNLETHIEREFDKFWAHVKECAEDRRNLEVLIGRTRR